MNIIKDIDQGSDEWLDLRMGKITASKFKDVLAKGKGGAASKTRLTYMYQIAAEIITGEREESFSNKYMEWGNEWESSARAAYELNHSVDIDQVAFIELDEGIGVSPDGLVGDNGLIEIKCPKTTTQIGWFLKGKVPPEHYAQIQGQIWVSGRDFCDFVSFDPRINGESGYFEVRVNRDEEYIENLKVECFKFIDELKQLLEKLQ